MATVEIKMPAKDFILDVLGTMVVGYFVWVQLGGAPIPIIAPFSQIVGTVAAVLIAWKFFRKN